MSGGYRTAVARPFVGGAIAGDMGKLSIEHIVAKDIDRFGKEVAKAAQTSLLDDAQVLGMTDGSRVVRAADLRIPVAVAGALAGAASSYPLATDGSVATFTAASTGTISLGALDLSGINSNNKVYTTLELIGVNAAGVTFGANVIAADGTTLSAYSLQQVATSGSYALLPTPGSAPVAPSEKAPARIEFANSPDGGALAVELKITPATYNTV